MSDRFGDPSTEFIAGLDPMYKSFREELRSQITTNDWFAFTMTAEDFEWVKKFVDNRMVRVMENEDGQLMASYTVTNMGQFFHSKRVSFGAIASVAVMPEARGHGVGKRMMIASIKEAAKVAVQTFYRSVGYEQCGVRYEMAIDLPQLDIWKPSGERLPVQAINLDKDWNGIEQCYLTSARTTNGYLDRPSYIWSLYHSASSQQKGYLVRSKEHPDAVEGYIFFTPERVSQELHMKLVVYDLCAVTKRAAEALIGFLRGFAGLGESATYHGHPSDLILTVMKEQCYRMRIDHTWMIRMTNIVSALEQRGYPACVSVPSLKLFVRDTLLVEQTGMYTLSLHNRQMKVQFDRSDVVPEESRDTCLEMDVSALGPLYTGYMTPLQLITAGMMRGGSEEVLSMAESVFGGRSPVMHDYF